MRILILLFFVNICFSQTPTAITINLEDAYPETIPNFNFFIEETIDNRFDKTSIGIVQKGMGNRRYFADLDSPIGFAFQNLNNHLFAESLDKEPYVIRINELFVREETKAVKEQGFAFIDFDILQKKNDTTYIFLKNYNAEVSNDKYSIDVTGKHNERIVASYIACLEKFSNDIENGFNFLNKKIAIRTKNNFLENHSSKGSSPAYYHTYTDFYNAFENTEANFTVGQTFTDRDLVEKVFIRDSKDSHCRDFIYYDGENYYLNAKTYSNDQYFVKTYPFLNNTLLFNDQLMSNYYLAMGKSGFWYNTPRSSYLFSPEDGVIYWINKAKMKTLLKENHPKLFKQFKRDGYKDIQFIKTTLEVLKKEYKGRENELISILQS